MSHTLITIPLSKLELGTANVRKTGATTGIDELAASIAALGLLQNLTVRPTQKANGKVTGRFEVIAGARRYTALKCLASRKRIAKHFGVPCHVLSESDPVEISLAENVVRSPLHPADQFDAFAALHMQGVPVEDIAARFGVTATVVRQRMKLAAVSPMLVAIYREGGMTLEQLMAFTVSDDHEAQERVWTETPDYAKEPQTIRRALTRSHVAGKDRRARFVGVQAYEAAGGTVIRDLFSTDDQGYFTDNELLDRLVVEKLAEKADEIGTEGWAWVESYLELDYTYIAKHDRAHATEVPRSAEDQARLDELSGRYDALVEEHGEDPPDDVMKELEELSEQIDAVPPTRHEWPEEEKSRAGAIVSLDYRGSVQVERGLMKPTPRGATSSSGTADPNPRKKGKGKPRGVLSEALVEDLSAHRTAALRESVAANPAIAFDALLYTFVVRTFLDGSGEGCIGVRTVVVDLRTSAEGIGESKAAKEMAERETNWRALLPQEHELWPWVQSLDSETKVALLAYCTAVTVNALRSRRMPNIEDRFAHADVLAGALALDMADWWEPTRENYLSRVSKGQVIAAVAEAVSRSASENIAAMKKEAMAARAEELLAGKRWLPEPLRANPSVRIEAK